MMQWELYSLLLCQKLKEIPQEHSLLSSLEIQSAGAAALLSGEPAALAGLLPLQLIAARLSLPLLSLTQQHLPLPEWLFLQGLFLLALPLKSEFPAVLPSEELLIEGHLGLLLLESGQLLPLPSSCRIAALLILFSYVSLPLSHSYLLGLMRLGCCHLPCVLLFRA